MMAAALLILCRAICPAAEFRGLFVDAFHPGFRNANEISQMVSTAKAANINALIVQVRKRGDAYYRSSLEPKASFLANDFDPLAEIIKQAHGAGIEVHAWLSVFLVMNEGKGYTPAANHVYAAHREWLTQTKDGTRALDNQGVYLDPAIPAVQDYTVSVVIDLAKHYAVDGIYLEGMEYPGFGAGYNPTSVDLFNKEYGRSGIPKEIDTNWCTWRRKQVTTVVQRIRAGTDAARPGLKLSVSTMMADPSLAAIHYLQDWDSWTREGLVDAVVPMIYATDDSLSMKVCDMLKLSHRRHVYVGIGAYRITSGLTKKHIEACRAAGADGIVLYSYYYLGPGAHTEQATTLRELGLSLFDTSTAVPAMPWKSGSTP